MIEHLERACSNTPNNMTTISWDPNYKKIMDFSPKSGSGHKARKIFIKISWESNSAGKSEEIEPPVNKAVFF